MHGYRIAAVCTLLIATGLFVCPADAADVRADFLKLIDRPRVPLTAEVKELPSDGKLAEFHFTFASDAEQRVPGILIKQKAADHGKAATADKDSNQNAATRRPVVIILHGTGGKKEDELPLLRELAGKGFIAVAIDGRYHGERTKAGKGSTEYQDAIVRAWRAAGEPSTDHDHALREHPFYFDTVWDVMRLVDYLETRDDVDKHRIGLMGFSKGGIETYLTAAADPRITVAVPCIGLETFRWALDNNAWQARVGTVPEAFKTAAKAAGVDSPGPEFVRQFYARLIPGIDGEFDGPSMAPLIAPRPLLVINGDSDDHTPLPGLKLCTDAAHAAYHVAGADNKFIVRIEEHTAHKVNADSQAAAVDWFVKWLKP